MPCRDDFHYPYVAGHNYSGQCSDSSVDQHSGLLAEALCDVLQVHEAKGDMSCFNKKTLKWWKQHKKRDKKRIQAELDEKQTELAKKKALKKLTDYERKLLGL